jgi:hypothetical protein
MEAVLQESELAGIERTDVRETYQFHREGEAFPFVDVSFILRSGRPNHTIVTDGPYRTVPLSPKSRLLYRERQNNSPRAEFSINVPPAMREEVAGSIANLLFNINEVNDVSEQE